MKYYCAVKEYSLIFVLINEVEFILFYDVFLLLINRYKLQCSKIKLS
jgi:hypothetical protein